ncbi:MAG: hypothetical protein AAFR01_06405 [Pseudomonadota bacterium]
MLRAALVLLFAAAQFGTSSLARFVDGARPIAVAVSPNPPLEQPAGYAFAIWFVIFALSVIFAVRHALGREDEGVGDPTLGWLAAGAFAANNVWMVLAQLYGNGWYLVLVIWLILGFASASLVRIVREPNFWSTADRMIAAACFGLLSAWLTAAAWLNTASYAVLLTGAPIGGDATTQAFAVLAAISVTGLIGLLLTRWQPFYAVTLAWAFTAVVVRNLDGSDIIATVAAVGACAALIIAATETIRRGLVPLAH